MTPHEQAAQRQPRKRRSQRRKDIGRRVPIVFSVLVLLGFTAVGIRLELDRPRVEAEVIAEVESRGGEVLRLSWGGRLSGPGYVDVLFDGQQSHCSLEYLTHTPAVFRCDPAVNRQGSGLPP